MNRRNSFLVICALSTLGAVALAKRPATYAEADFPRIDKIDAHVHLYGELPVFLERVKADGFRVLTINVNYADFPPLPEQLASAVALRNASPERVAFAATFNAEGSDRPEWLGRTQGQLDAALSAGAVAVKVWKDIGMQWRDPDGRVVMVDDARFAPIFDSLAARHVVVLGHQGEPRNAWLPLEQMTINGDREYFGAHPNYHMALHPEWPSYEKQLAARDRMLEAHPTLKFVGVHLASLEWDVDRIAEFLDRHPTACVDLAARMAHLQRQAVTHRDRVRSFFIKYQDRILYGTDQSWRPYRTPEVTPTDAEREKFSAGLEAQYRRDWAYYAGTGPSDYGGDTVEALALPQAVLEKFYWKNAERIVGVN